MTLEMAKIFFIVYLLTIASIVFLAQNKNMKRLNNGTIDRQTVLLRASFLLLIGSFLNWDFIAKQFEGTPYVIFRIIAGTFTAVALGMVFSSFKSLFTKA